MMDIIVKKLDKLSMSRIKNKHIYLMGRLEHVLAIKQWLEERDLTVAGILDNDSKKSGMRVKGSSIDLPQSFLMPYDAAAMILIYSPKYWEDMVEQLTGYGYMDGEHIIVLDRPDEKKNKQLVREGYALYQQLQKNYGRDVFVFLTNCPLGDYYLLGIYLKQYCEKNGIEKYVVVGESLGLDKLSTLFGIEHTMRLTTEQSNALIRAWIFLGKDRMKMKPLTIWQGAFRFNPCRVRQAKGFTFMDTFPKMIFGLSDAVLPRHPNMVYDKETIKEVFEKHGLIPHKTILLAPFAYSLPTLSSDFWKRLAEVLQQRGYSIAVNVGEDRESNFLPGTVGLNFDFTDIVGVMELAGTVIGMRSGFFDITSQAKCKRIVLYPKTVGQNVPWNSTDIQFCSLASMGLCEDAVELEATDETQVLDEILRNLG